MIILLMGPPGAGKGTQATLLEKATGLPHVSTGDLFRAVNPKTPLGAKVSKIMAGGELVRDSLTNELLAQRLQQKDCAKGFLLDGYPRTLAQAKYLDAWLKKRKKRIDAVLYFDLPVAEAVGRLSSRLTCDSCGMVYNKLRTPGVKKCVCGGSLYRRDDQSPAAVKKRFAEYELKTKPVLAHYAAKLRRIDSGQTSEKAFHRAVIALDCDAAERCRKPTN